MDAELLVRLVQMQMYSSTFGDQTNRDSGIGGMGDFAMVLAALMNQQGAVAGGQAVHGASAASRINGLATGKPASLQVTDVTGGHLKVDQVKAGNDGSLSGIEEVISKAADKFGLRPDLLRAVIKVESDFNPLAMSSAGAMGLMQLMPETARSLGVNNPFDPQENIEGGAMYLKSLLGRFNGDINLALAAYNAGPGAVERYGGVPPYRETISYLQKVKSLLNVG